MSGRQWQAGLEEQQVAWSSSESKVRGQWNDYFERRADVKVDIEALERLIEPEDQRSLSDVHPEVLDERRQQYFPAF